MRDLACSCDSQAMALVQGQCDFCFDMTLVVEINHSRFDAELCAPCLREALLLVESHPDL